MPISADTTLSPPTAADQARLGWKMQRRLAERERAEQAAWAEAIATGRTVRGGTFRVTLPREYSRAAETADGTPTGAVLDGHGREIVEVTLPRNFTADPKAGDRWTWRVLSTAAMREAEAARKTIRPRPSREAGEDAAASVIADILSATRGGMPRKDDWTRDRLRVAIRRDLIDATREDRNPAIDTDADAHGEDIATMQAASEMRRAQRDRDPMLRAWADPLSREDHAAADALDLGDRARDAIAADAHGLRAPDIGEARGIDNPTTVRSRIKRGRADIAKLDPCDVRDAYRAADAATGEDRRQRAARSLRDLIGQPEHRDENRPTAVPPERMPARHPGDALDAFTVAHAPVTIRRGSDAPRRADNAADID